MTPKQRGKKVYITRNPKIRRGAPCIRGTRIPIRLIRYLYKKKKISKEKIVTQYYPWVSLFTLKNVIKEMHI